MRLSLQRNIKKDPAERKSLPDYARRKLANLKDLWSDFQRNHIQLCAYEEIKQHPYIISSEYQLATTLYESTKALIKQIQARGSVQHPILVKASISDVRDRAASPLPANKPAATIVTPDAAAQHNEGNQPSQQQTSSNVTNESAQQAEPPKSNGKLRELLRKQISNFKAFERTISNIDLSSMSEKWEFEYTLKSLQQRWSAIDSLHWEVDMYQEGEDEVYQNVFSKHERIYNDYIKSINSKLWSVAHREYSTPKMDIPVFTGNYQHWTSFKDLFLETIDRNPSLSNAQRMQFLKSKVKGEAENLIRHLQISSENYTIS